MGYIYSFIIHLLFIYFRSGKLTLSSMQVIFFSFLHCLTFFFGFLPHPIYHLPLTLSSTSLHSPLTSLPIPITPFFPPIPSANPLISSPYPSPIPPLFTLPVTLFQHSLRHFLLSYFTPYFLHFPSITAIYSTPSPYVCYSFTLSPYFPSDSHSKYCLAIHFSFRH